MVLLSCRATPFRRQLFVNISASAFSLSMLLLFAVMILEIFAYITLESADIIKLLDTNMPVINRKAIAVFVLICAVLLIQMFSVNIVREQNVVRLRAVLKTSTEKIFFMSLAPAILLFSAVLCIVYANKFKSAVAVGLLQTIVRYDDKPVDRLFVDKFQSFYNCCGVNGDDDYRDLSSVKLDGYKKWAIVGCSACSLLPAESAWIGIESHFGHRRCLSSLLSSALGLLDPSLPIWLLFIALGIELIALIFAQLALTSYLTLSESGLSDADESVAWILAFSYPSPEDIIQHLADWAAELYAEEDEGEHEPVGKTEISDSSSHSESSTKVSRKAIAGKRNLPRK
uniref:Tetraspanin n=1 Tax=Angiostrongylus cantonensis TaxID=6313 RepID=A0A0K0D3W3_ANGCA